MTALANLGALLLGVAASCTPAQVETSVPPPSSLRAVEGGACFGSSDCASGEMCVDPRYPVCGAQPACEDAGIVQCGCRCLARCTASSCAADETCGASGCCEPRACSTEAECGSGGDARCVEGRCVRPGTCTLPPP